MFILQSASYLSSQPIYSKMPVSHVDLAPSQRWSSDLGSKTGAFLMVLTILCGLLSFILCLVAETTRSLATSVVTDIDGGKDAYECVYSGSGKVPLVCGAAAFLSLALAMVMEHVYMLISLNKAMPPALIAWNPDASSTSNSLTWRAAFFFFTTWICFAIGEVILLIAVGVESGHLTKWSRPRVSCLVVGQGLFLAGGTFGLMTVFLLTGLYLTALHAQRLHQEEEIMRREVLETAIFYASPPRSPRHRPMANVAEIPRTNRQEHNDQRQRIRDPPPFDKSISSLA